MLDLLIPKLFLKDSKKSKSRRWFATNALPHRRLYEWLKWNALLLMIHYHTSFSHTVFYFCLFPFIIVLSTIMKTLSTTLCKTNEYRTIRFYSLFRMSVFVILCLTQKMNKTGVCFLTFWGRYIVFMFWNLMLISHIYLIKKKWGKIH